MAHVEHMSRKLSRDPGGKLHICCENVAVEINMDIMNKFPEIRQQILDTMIARDSSHGYSRGGWFGLLRKPRAVWRRDKFATQANVSEDHPKPPDVVLPARNSACNRDTTHKPSSQATRTNGSAFSRQSPVNC